MALIDEGFDVTTYKISSIRAIYLTVVFKPEVLRISVKLICTIVDHESTTAKFGVDTIVTMFDYSY